MRLTEKEIIKQLHESASQYEPVRFKKIETEFFLTEKIQADAVAEFTIDNGPSFKALIEIKTLANPKTILVACKVLRDELERVNNPEFIPIIIAPYIGDKQAAILAKEGISWIDLSGNMRIQILNKVYIERTGKLNKYPDTVPIRKIFQGTSSLVTRALLLQPEGFSSINKVTDFINSRNANITLSTVSKVLNSLEQELYIDKSKSLIRVRDAKKLLDKLTEGSINSTQRKMWKTYKFAVDKVKNIYMSLWERQIEYAAYGFYAAQLKGLTVTNEINIFVKDIEQLKKAAEHILYSVKFVPDSEFGNFSITETDDPGVWFNISKQTNMIDCSVIDDIELYLEMAVDKPRGPKIAEIIKTNILRGFNG
ncbi:MAG: hypothetical protein ABFD79_16930 [Phycisphaerales bacterium]